MLDLLGMTRPELIAYVAEKFGKGEFYGDALFRELYGNSDRGRERSSSPAFVKFYSDLTSSPLPEVVRKEEEAGTVKFLLEMDKFPGTTPGNSPDTIIGRSRCSESVLIPMKNYSTLCLSSQIGCRFGCRFCATGQMGLVRNLSAAEIMAQVWTARFTLGASDLQNIVFMGMGEPFDNFDSILKAIDILSDERGLGIPKRRISVSTAGHCGGIEKLSALCAREPGENYHTLHLSLSLHSAIPEVRNSLMPIGKIYPLKQLRQCLQASPFSRIKDGLYIEYLIIPGVTDRPSDIDALKNFLDGMQVKINLIPYNPVKGSSWRAPCPEEINSLWLNLKESGYYCRTRTSKGETMMAACGQLGSRSRA